MIVNDLSPASPSEDRALLLGSYVDMGGVARAKIVPVGRRESFARSGMGASPSWAVFCHDEQIAFTDAIGVAGDLRLRIDESSIRPLSSHTLWGATVMQTQDGEPRLCPRTRLSRVEAALNDAGFRALVGIECEFYLLDPAVDDAVDIDLDAIRGWHAYGTDSVLSQEEFIVALLERTRAAGITVEQIHCEYALNQYEVSAAPSSPLLAADNATLLRALIRQTARHFGLVASFSPKPFAETSGNGAHLHLSLSEHDGTPLLSGGAGPYGLTESGQHLIAGIQSTVVELTAIYAGSPVSPLRLAPHSWAGAAVCWGLENREAAIRLCAATLGNPHGASVELKMVDPSANPYLAIAALLGSALHGIRQKLPLASEVSGNPEDLSSAEISAAKLEIIPSDPSEVTAAFSGSAIARDLLGEDVFSAVLAVRNLMTSTYADTPVSALTRRFRTTW